MTLTQHEWVVHIACAGSCCERVQLAAVLLRDWTGLDWPLVGLGSLTPILRPSPSNTRTPPPLPRIPHGRNLPWALLSIAQGFSSMLFFAIHCRAVDYLRYCYPNPHQQPRKPTTHNPVPGTIRHDGSAAPLRPIFDSSLAPLGLQIQPASPPSRRLVGLLCPATGCAISRAGLRIENCELRIAD